MRTKNGRAVCSGTLTSGRTGAAGWMIRAALAGFSTLLALSVPAFAGDPPSVQAPTDRPPPLPVNITSWQTQKVIWHGRNAVGPAATTFSEPVLRDCPPVVVSVANNFNSYGNGSSATLELGMVQGEGFGSSYSIPANAFPVQVTLVEAFFASVAPIQTDTAWRLDVYDGPPTLGNVVFTVLSDPDPADSGLPGDVVIGPASSTCNTSSGAQAAGLKLQFSVDMSTATQGDLIIVNNTSGTGIVTIVFRIVHMNNPPANGCATVDPCSNAFMAVTPTGAASNPGSDWLYAANCAGGAPAGFSSFSSLNVLFRPTGDVLEQMTYVPTQCVTVPTGACCLASGTCQIATGASCASQSGTYKGDNSTCAAANCPQPSGACCLPFGGCSLQSTAGCAAISGVFGGANSTCGSITCAVPVGACCAGTVCVGSLDQTTCVSLGGSFEGNATACGPSSSCPLGACCLPDGSCITGESAPQCALQNGTFKGVGSTCTGANCPQPSGACCTSTGSCVSVPQATCIAFSGNTWQGAFTTCGTGTCPTTAVGVCCSGASCSTVTTQAQCTGANTLWVAQTTAACNAAGTYKTPCCKADFNKTGGVTVQDIFSYLTAWFAKSPSADTDGSGTVTIQDIFSFLTAWFQGPCT